MHKTNGSWVGREIYDGSDLTTINLLAGNFGMDSRVPIGAVHIRTTYRFAGRRNPVATLAEP